MNHRHRASRRHFIQRSGLGLTAAIAAPGTACTRAADTDDLDFLARQVLEGSPVQLTEARREDLKREIEAMRKSLAQIRAFRLRGGSSPAAIFRAR